MLYYKLCRALAACAAIARALFRRPNARSMMLRKALDVAQEVHLLRIAVMRITRRLPGSASPKLTRVASCRQHQC